MGKPVRTLRRWRQRLKPNAKFVWRRSGKYEGKIYKPGDDIPEALASSPNLRRFWESRFIQLIEVAAPVVDAPKLSVVKSPEPQKVEAPVVEAPKKKKKKKKRNRKAKSA